MSDDIRAIRIALPIRQIREMDQLILQGAAGFQTRTEFIQEAVDNLLIELRYPAAPTEPVSAELVETAASPPAVQPVSRDETRINSRNITSFTGVDGIPPEGQVLFGMHNRDYPSLWALWRIAEMTATEAIPFDEVLTEVSRQAWEHGNLLERFAASTGGKHTALFPTNRNKVPAATGAFQLFAIGYVAGQGPSVQAGGPLFEWQTCSLTPTNKGYLVGLTEAGLDLLRSLDGLDVVEPHDPAHSARFVEHLKRYAPADWWGFQRVLESSVDGVSRIDLVADFRAERSGWKESVVNTNVAGYVARAREWGLLQQKQTAGKYWTTELGEQLLAEGSAK